jgi:hypothetical protein
MGKWLAGVVTTVFTGVVVWRLTEGFSRYSEWPSQPLSPPYSSSRGDERWSSPGSIDRGGRDEPVLFQEYPRREIQRDTLAYEYTRQDWPRDDLDYGSASNAEMRMPAWSEPQDIPDPPDPLRRDREFELLIRRDELRRDMDRMIEQRWRTFR